MFRLLSKLFVKDWRNYKDLTVRLNLISLSSIVSFTVNFILVVLKFAVGLFTNSLAVIGDAFNNLSDVLSSLISFLASKISKKPADREHPYGHGRSEYIASFLVSVLIVIVGFELFKEALISIIQKKEIQASIFSLLILIFTYFLKFYIYILNKILAKKLNSTLNRAISVDSRNDLFATSAIIISVFIKYFFNISIDGYMSIIVSIMILKSGIDLSRETVDKLLGRSICEKKLARISEIILDCVIVLNFHKLEVHDYGEGIILGSCHVEIPANISIQKSHKYITDMEKKIREQTGVELTLHIDPTFCFTKERIKELNLDVVENFTEDEYEDLQNK